MWDLSIIVAFSRDHSIIVVPSFLHGALNFKENIISKAMNKRNFCLLDKRSCFHYINHQLFLIKNNFETFSLSFWRL